MRNLHELKSFHENALNEWNATALIMKEALKDEPDARKTFVEVVLALSDMAGKDAIKRKNLIKAGHIVLHSMADGKLPKTPPPIPSVEPTKKPDRWKGVRRVGLLLFMLLLCVGSFAGGFALNTPRLVSYLPSTSTPAAPSNTPEELLKQYVDAVSHKDIQRALGLFTPEARKSVEYTMSETSEGFEKGIMPKLRIDHIENSTSAKAFVTLIANEKEIDSGIIYLRQIDNAWYIDRFSM